MPYVIIISGEFSIWSDSLFDDPDARYKKLRKTAGQFLISQFGTFLSSFMEVKIKKVKMMVCMGMANLSLTGWFLYYFVIVYFAGILIVSLFSV